MQIPNKTNTNIKQIEIFQSNKKKIYITTIVGKLHENTTFLSEADKQNYIPHVCHAFPTHDTLMHWAAAEWATYTYRLCIYFG